MKIFYFFFNTWIIFILNILIFQILIFFLLIIPQCIMEAACINQIDVSDNIIPRLQFFIENIFYPKRKKSTFLYC